MIYKPTKKVTKIKLDSALVRNKTVPCKANDYEIETISALAAECGMYTSAYMLARALNYEPHARLSDEERAQQAAAAVARKRGWKTAEQVRESALNSLRDGCFGILSSMDSWSFEAYINALQMRGYDVKITDDKQGDHRGYVIRNGNCKYKASDIHRGLTASRIQQTWENLHTVNPEQQMPTTSMSDIPEVISQETIYADKPNVPTAYDYLVKKPRTILYAFTFFGKTVEFYIPEAAMSVFETEFSMDDCANSAELTQYAAVLFVMLIGGENTVKNGGGGGATNDSDWGRDPIEDDRNWALRCAKMAVSKIGRRPSYRFKR